MVSKKFNVLGLCALDSSISGELASKKGSKYASGNVTASRDKGSGVMSGPGSDLKVFSKIRLERDK